MKKIFVLILLLTIRFISYGQSKESTEKEMVSGFIKDMFISKIPVDTLKRKYFTLEPHSKRDSMMTDLVEYVRNEDLKFKSVKLKDLKIMPYQQAKTLKDHQNFYDDIEPGNSILAIVKDDTVLLYIALRDNRVLSFVTITKGITITASYPSLDPIMPRASAV